MPRLVQFVLALIAGLALLAWGVTEFVQRTARQWFERDMSLGARLVVTGARASLAAHWGKDHQQDLKSQLIEIARDERMMAAAACDADLSMLASTPGFPEDFGCHEVGSRMLSPETSP